MEKSTKKEPVIKGPVTKDKPMWNKYYLEMRFTEDLMGGIPKHPDIIAKWIDSRKASDARFAKLPDPVSLSALTEQVIEEVDAVAEAEAKVWCGFKHDEQGMYVNSYHIKSHLKDTGNILQKWLDFKALKAKLADRTFVEEQKLYLFRDGEPLKEADDYWEHPVHAMTPLGKISALKRTDYVTKCSINCVLRVLNDGVITENVLRQILEYGSTKGFGAERGLGNGRYTFSLKALTEAEKRC